MSQCAHRSFRLACFTYFRRCLHFVLSPLACDLSTLYCFCFGCFSFSPTHHPLFLTFPACVFSFYLLLILLLFHLISGGRDAYVDRARCFNVTSSATGQENALPPGIAHEVLIAEPRSPHDIHTAPIQSHSRSP